jgi:hypothetical protein
MKTYCIAILALALISPAAYAMGDEASQQEMFGKMKQIKVDGIQGRISNMQSLLSCVKAATNHEQFKSCDEQDRKSNESLMQQQKAKWDALKPQK